MTIKVLNLYAGIGGNRKLWENVDVTAVEINESVAAIYKDFFPNDKVIVGDAHEYLLEHYKEYDFIWSSPPCPTHSRLRKTISMGIGAKAVYPDMKLYEEILFLEGYFKSNYVVENVRSWYIPLIRPYLIERHYFWSNKILSNIKITNAKIQLANGSHKTKESDKEQVTKLQKELGFDLSKYHLPTMKARTMLRNCVNPETGLHIFNMAFKEKQEVLVTQAGKNDNK